VILGTGCQIQVHLPTLPPCLSDVKEVEEGLDLGVEVDDGHIVQC